MTLSRLAAALSLALLVPGSPAIGQTPASPVFKGQWAGPGRPAIPGPGPQPGQSLEDYFEHLPTGQRTTSRPNILVLGGGAGFHHDSISTAMAAVLRWGQETGAWDAELRTDFTLLYAGGGGPMRAGFQPKGLGDFDAVVIAGGEGEWPLAPAQKAALLAFVHDRGKGIVVIHGGIAANRGWRDYIDMIGAEQTGHPFNTLDHVVRPFVLIREDGDFPATAALPRRFVKQDELYVVRNWSRADVDVLLRLDETTLDFTGIEDQVPPDRDLPIAWAKTYGRGRVFASSLGHTRESFADPDIAGMYIGAIRWALRLADGGIGPHPRPPKSTQLPSQKAGIP
ncbi:ThuA domain-containing protein [Sphingomonas sp. 2SG]|uniref:ThuA domain-containing protein n=1 Tax=Sphingomonas sp. 2SG TaxID=2502201 RepID=UPI001BB1C2A8|nr:ThuA domain-containing protein [Sphingomonas sp. 2SG]